LDGFIDLGPEGGAAGGKLIAQGTPEQVAQTPGSYTGQFLKEILVGEGILLGGLYEYSLSLSVKCPW